MTSLPKNQWEHSLFYTGLADVGPARGKYVYHYTKCETALSFILGGKRQLLVNTARKMNDPLEFNSRHLLGSGGTDHVIRIDRALDAASRDGVRLFSASLDRPAVIVPHPNGPIVQKPGRRGFDHPAMWAHYADNHTGVCLIFERIALDGVIQSASSGLDVVSGEVEYHPWSNYKQIDNRVHADDQVGKMDANQLKKWAMTEVVSRASNIFLTKHDDWAAEEEFRWLLLGNQPGKFFADLNEVTPVGIVVGSLAGDEDIKSFSELANQTDMPARIMMWTDGHPNILGLCRMTMTTK